MILKRKKLIFIDIFRFSLQQSCKSFKSSFLLQQNFLQPSLISKDIFQSHAVIHISNSNSSRFAMIEKILSLRSYGLLFLCHASIFVSVFYLGVRWKPPKSFSLSFSWENERKRIFLSLTLSFSLSFLSCFIFKKVQSKGLQL